MKILHITSYDNGGAGLCCVRIHHSLLKQGIDSKVLTLHKSSADTDVYKYNADLLSIFFVYWDKVLSKLQRLLGIRLTARASLNYLSKKNKLCLSLPLSRYNILDNPLVEWADIIHLHWVNDFLDYPSFFKNISKPVVWTLHDENFFYGVAHYYDSRVANTPIEIKYSRIKQDSIRCIDQLAVVLLSNTFINNFSAHILLQGRKVKLIHNSVDSDEFKPIAKKNARECYNIEDDMIIFGFTSHYLVDPRKGLKELCQALYIINNPKIRILAIGNYSSEDLLPDIVIPVGFIDTPCKLSKALSACDYFAFPSFQEAFAQSPLEALSCGLPVIAFPVSGCPDLISENNGVLCDDFSVEALVKGIKKILKNKYNHTAIRQGVIDNFSPKKIALEYIELYKEMLSKDF